MFCCKATAISMSFTIFSVNLCFCVASVFSANLGPSPSGLQRKSLPPRQCPAQPIAPPTPTLHTCQDSNHLLTPKRLYWKHNPPIATRLYQHIRRPGHLCRGRDSPKPLFCTPSAPSDELASVSEEIEPWLVSYFWALYSLLYSLLW